MRELLRSALWAGLLIAVTPALPGGLAVLETLLTDNGDDDGYADTKETVTLRLKLQNTTDDDLTGVAVHFTTKDYALVCVVNPTIEVGDLLAGEVRETAQGFELVVADVDRATLGLDPYADLSIGFEMSATADLDSPVPTVYPWRGRLDIDLDVSGGSGPSTFFESFESGMGAFDVDNKDQGKSSLAGSDGFRCQYNDPDWMNSFTYGDAILTEECYMAASPSHADAEFWGLSGPETSPGGGRAFSGFHSLFWGIDFGEPMNWSSPIGAMEAAATIDPIYLGWDDVTPGLSMIHMASLIDGRNVEIEQTGAGDQEFTDKALDRGIVMVQVADDQDDPVGDWYKLEPYANVYDQQASNNFPNCMFDPVDDGTNEDMFFKPNDPDRLYGPSTSCFPEYVFAGIGETSNPFAAGNLGSADGPGLEGVWGIGTWIESKFDLARFRGQRIRLRFLASALQVVPNEHWEEYLGWNPVSADDGWWIDDVTVTGALSTPASVAADITDNSGLPGPPPSADPDDDFVCTVSDNCPTLSNPDQADADLDGAGTACDCNDLDGTIYPGAIEINDGQDNQCPGDAGYGVADEISGVAGFFDPNDKNVFSWPTQPGAARYEVARARSADFTMSCTVFPPVDDTLLSDTAPVFPGVVYYYLVRSTYPYVGSWGLDSSDDERVVPCAP